MPAPVIWNFQLRGTGEAKREMESLGSATRSLDADTVKLAKSLRSQARDATVVTNTDQYRAKIIMAQHPNLVRMTQATQNMAQAFRMAAAAQTLLNTAMLLMQGKSASEVQIKNDLARAERELADMRAQGLEGSTEYLAKQEDINKLNADLKETTDANTMSMNSQVIATGLTITGFASMINKQSFLITSLSKLSGALGVAGLLGRLGMVGGAIVPLIGIIGGLAHAFGTITSISTIWDKVFGTKMNDFFMQNVGQLFEGKLPAFFQYSAMAFEEMGKRIWGAMQGLGANLAGSWAIMKSGFLGLWNGIVNVANSGVRAIISGLEGVANAFIAVINGAIAARNALAGALGLSKIPMVAKVSIPVPKIPAISAAAGFDGTVSSPTMFLAGEGGQTERVRIGAGNNGNFGGGSGGNHIEIHIHAGSVIAEKDLINKVKRSIDLGLRHRGANR